MHFQPGVSLILGGARSGKSAFAERLAGESTRQKVYFATSEIWDDEMAERVDLHKARRGDDWQVIEEPLAIGPLLEEKADESTCILVDCLTLWVMNLMMAERDTEQAFSDLISSLRRLKQNTSVLFVSNEVGQGIVPMEKMARDFRDLAGRLHQDIAAVADNVWFVTAGLPQKLK